MKIAQNYNNKVYKFLSLFFLILSLGSCTNEYIEIKDTNITQKEAKISLGEKLFFEKNLSNPGGQSCASCHSPETGFSDPQHHTVSPGINPELFGNRNAPSLAYGIFAPERFYNDIDETYIGGLFYDGRSKNLETQVLGPLLNPVEMNNTSTSMVVEKIKSLPFYSDFKAIYGETNDDNKLLSQLADAISSFEKSKKVNSFTSKFDYYSRQLVPFTSEEKKGLDLFKGKANCASCHILEPDENTGKVLFTDFSYDNIGVPKNEKNPFYKMSSNINPQGINHIDYGIGSIVNQAAHNGKFKVPSLRNVAVSSPYFHNGFYTTLEEVIHFYNVRNIENQGTPEVSATVNTTELGNLKLTPAEEKQLKLFLETLTDHYRK